MARLYCVTLPLKHEPRFPHRCVVCQKPPPTWATVAHEGEGTRWRLSPLFRFIAEGSASVPVCRRCWWRLKAQRLLRIWVYPGIGFAALFSLLPAGGRRGMDQDLVRLWWVIGAVVFAAMVYGAFERSYPRHYHASVDGEMVRYAFARRKYAMEFARINAGSVRVE